jgi:hypothetical protein
MRVASHPQAEVDLINLPKNQAFAGSENLERLLPETDAGCPLKAEYKL